MRRITVLLMLFSGLTHAQDILPDIDRLQNLINVGDWAAAADLSSSLKTRVATARNQALAVRGPGMVDSILGWLPADTETLLVAQEPFSVSNPPTAARLVAGLLAVAEKGELLKRLDGRTVTMAAVGARKFGEGGPTDNVPRLGMVPYEGCAVYQLGDVQGDPMARAPDEEIDGHGVWESKGSEGDGPDWETFYVTMPQLLLVCNNREFFREVLSRQKTPKQPRALPSNLIEWSLLDRSSPVWGISHYRNGGMARLAWGGPEAVGIAVSYGKTAIIARMISRTDPWGPFASEPQFQGGVKTRAVSDGVWELAVPSDGQGDGTVFLALMAALGFVVVI